MKYLHTMVRISNVEESLQFYCELLGLREVRRSESEAGRCTNIFLASPEDLTSYGDTASPMIELTFNWDPENYTGGRNFGHLAFGVDNIYEACQKLQDGGVLIKRPPRDGKMAFVSSPDGISIELLQKGPALEAQEPLGFNEEQRFLVASY